MKILDFIPCGRENAISGKELINATGWDSRTVKQQIANARLNGSVICSILDGNNGGYYIPATPTEAVDYVRTEEKRIESATEALRAAKVFIEKGGF